MRLADGSNSGRYAGSTVIPWTEILGKVPVLKDKKEYLEPKPYSTEDSEKMQKYKSYNLSTTDPVAELGSEEEVELWMELRGPDFNNVKNGDVIFGNLPEELQKKYIGLGNELSGNMVRALSPSALAYYFSKKREKLLQKTLSQLSESDMELIMSKEMKPYIRSLKAKYIDELNSNFDPEYVTITYPNQENAKFARMFGLETLFDAMPENTTFLQIENKSNDNITLKIPDSIGKFRNLETLVCDNIIDEVPSSIGECTKLSFLNLTNNKNLTTLPASIGKLTCLDFVSIIGSNIDVESLPEEITRYMDVNGEFWDVHFPEEMKTHC
jgi:Leucine-rich repeat (LRR) protein